MGRSPIETFDPEGLVAQMLFDAVLSEGPPGANPANQKFPDNFDQWSEERRQTWFTQTARATCIAQQCHLEQILRDVDKILSGIIVAVRGGVVTIKKPTSE